MAKSKKVAETWVYQGRIANAKDQIRYVYQRVVDDELVGEDLWFATRLMKHQGVGTMIEVMVAHKKEGGVSVDHETTYLGFGNFSAAKEWVVRDAVTHDASLMRGKVKRDAEEAGMKSIVEPIRRMYWRSRPAARAAIIARVVYEITRGRK